MRIGLIFKMIFLVSVLFSFVGFLTVTRHLNNYETGLLDTYEKNSYLVSTSIATTLNDRADMEDKEKLFNIIQAQMWNNKEILEISFSKPENDSFIVFAANEKHLEGKISSKEAFEVFKTGVVYKNKHAHNEGERALIFIVPIKISGKIYGTVETHLSLNSFDKNISNQVRTEIFLTTIVGFFSFLVFFFFLNTFVKKPIYGIKKGLEEVSRNNLDYKIKKLSDDEFGELAKSFDLMRLEIKKSRKESDEYNKDLEGKVKKRTKELEKKIKELEKFSRIVIGRELRMLELKKELRKYKEGEK